MAAFPDVEVVEADFDAWEPHVAEFDAVVAFTAFHWISPEVRYAKPAALLREGGALAVVGVHHVMPEDGDPFFVDVQEDYRASLPEGELWSAPLPEEVGGIGDEIEASELFAYVETRRYLWDVTYTADQFVAVVDTYSDHRSLDEQTRRGFRPNPPPDRGAPRRHRAEDVPGDARRRATPLARPGSDPGRARGRRRDGAMLVCVRDAGPEGRVGPAAKAQHRGQTPGGPASEGARAESAAG